MGWVLLAIFYLLTVVTGIAIAAGSRMSSWLGRTVVAVTCAAAQVVASVQVLSLFHGLSQVPFLAANAAITALTLLVLRACGIRWLDELQKWRFKPLNVRCFVRENPLSALLLAVAVVGGTALSLVKGPLMPNGDTYHYAMPLFWQQHASALPFASCNPRVVGLSFGSEALCFPGTLYAKSWGLFIWLPVFAKFLITWLVADLAWRLGASLGASVAAGAVLFGYLPFEYATVELLLAPMWVAAAVWMLTEARQGEGNQRWCLGFAFFSLMMACGTKNAASLHAPLFLLLVLWWWGRRIFEWKNARAVVLGGVLGLTASSTLWCYAGNQAWFGDVKGPQFLRDHVGQNYDPTSVWTRIVRASSMGLIDPVWIPRSMRDSYEKLVRGVIGAAGGADKLAEDDWFYVLVLPGENLRPGAGLGPLGLLLFAPSLICGLVGWRRRNGPAEPNPEARRMRISLSALAIASLFLGFAVLRTQPIGVTRLLTSALIIGTPLAALLLEFRWMRLVALGVQSAVIAALMVHGLGEISRRSPADYPWLAKHLGRLQQDHTVPYAVQWGDGTSERFLAQENWSFRELYDLVLPRLPSPVTIGSLSSLNADDVYLFGPQFENRVICLIDSARPNEALPIPAEVEYIFSDIPGFAGLDYEAAGFSVWFEAKPEDGPSLTIFKRTPSAP